MRALLLVGLGGAIGSMLRYLAVLFVSNRLPGYSFPFGTLAVNFTGSLLIGIVYGLSVRYEWLSPQLRLFLVTGILGGYTTFSAFALENMILFQETGWISGFIYIVASVVLCLAAVFLGFSIVKAF